MRSLMTSKIYIIDISSYIFRAYFAVRPLSTSSGIPTNATYGVATMIQKLIREKKPDYLVVAYDSPKPSFRKELYQDYKANREVPPEDLIPQFDQIKEYIDSYPIPSIQHDGFEADDIVATVAKHFSIQENFEVIIVSSDKDLMQLIDDKVCMYDSMKNKLIKEDQVIEKFGVKPDQVLDLLSLAGDTSDNIPGVKGVGVKTAAKLLNEMGTLEDILAGADSIKGKLGEKIINHKEDALISKKLVQLKTDLEIPVDKDFYLFSKSDQNKLNEFFIKYELNSLVVDSHQNSKDKKIAINQDQYELILTEESLKNYIQKIKKHGLFSFDTETDSLNPRNCNLVGISLSIDKGNAVYIPLRHSYLGCPDQLGLETVRQLLNPILSDKNIKKVAQNAKFDWHVLNHHNFELEGPIFDTMIASYLIDSNQSHSMDALSLKYLEHETIHFKDIVGKNQTFADIELIQALKYAAEDADITYRLHEIFSDKLDQLKLNACFNDYEIPLVNVLRIIEDNGMLIDQAKLKELNQDFTSQLEKLEKTIYKEAGEEFNIHSPKQLANILFDKLQLTPIKKTKTGYSTNVDVLNKLSLEHSLPQYILEFRTLAKLKSTYIEGLTKIVDQSTSRVHTNFHQTVAATGRLSSVEPNLQNIPIRGEQGRKIREVFIASDECELLSADYSQIELRLLAAFSQDPNLVKTFKEDGDIHTMTACKIFGLSENEIDSELRSKAKTVNFGILYGQSPFGLSEQLNISQSEAKHYIEQFYEQFPSVIEYKNQIIDEASKTGEVRTYSGRRRLVPELNSKNKMIKKNAERFAFNTIFQGSAADIIKKAMINIHEELIKQNLKSKMILQVHDELLFEVPLDEKDILLSLVKGHMESVFDNSLPLTISTGWGKNWSESH